MKVLNLYACLGGNRLLWDDCEVTAVELDPVLAELYQERFPDDKVIVGDAHDYLLKHFSEFDFIWTSPPCPTHSRARYWGVGANGKDPVYPDMKLYQEIIFLQTHFKGKFVVENVIPYYEPLLPAYKRGRHLFWTNFHIPNELSKRHFEVCRGANEVSRLCEFHDYDFRKYKGKQRIQKIARNLVDYVAGKTIFDVARDRVVKNNSNQTSLF